MTQLKHDSLSRLLGPLTIRSWMLLLGTCLVLYGVNLGGARVLTHHEIDVAGGARQMIAEGDWLIPKIGDHSWLEKPPLLHWLAGALIILFGEASEWVVRLPSVAAGVVLVFLVAMMVGRWLGEKAGLVAGLIQCTSWYMMTYARLAEADILLACIVVAAIVVFIHLQGIGLPQPSNRPRLLALVFWVLIGLTNLCKGPLFGAAMVLTPCLAWLLWRRESPAWKQMWSPTGLALGILIAVAWPALVLMKEPAALDLWLYHTVGRAKGATIYSRPWWYYVPMIPTQLLPWTPITLIGTVPSLKRMWREGDSADRFTWLWALVPIFLLSFARGKSHHYLLSCLPGFTLVTTIAVLEIEQHIREKNRYAVAVARGAIFVLAPGALLGGLVAGFKLTNFRADAWILGVVVCLGMLLAGVFTLRRRPSRVFAVFLLTLVLSVVQVHVHLLPARDTRRPDRRFLTTLQEHLPPQPLIFATGGPEIVRHIFYVQVPLIGVWNPEDIGKHLGEEKVFFVVTRMNQLRLLERFGSVSVVSQSEYTRNEESPQDRFTLFRVQRIS